LPIPNKGAIIPSIGQQTEVHDAPHEYRATSSMHEPSIPSDNLAHLRENIVKTPHLKEIVGLPLQIWLVIDTNAVIADLLWLAGKRKNPTARTDLQELIDAGTVIAFAPDWLREEVAEHLPSLAQKRSIAEDRLREEWQAYQKYLRFCPSEPGGAAADRQVVDPYDLPFIDLYHEVGARAVVSKDHHIAEMGAGTIRIEVMRQLRDYARAESVVVTIKLAGHAGTTVLSMSAVLTAQLAVALARRFVRLPLWVQFALLVGAGMVALHPRSRAAIETMWHKVASDCGVVATRFEPALAALILMFMTESARASDSLQTVEQALPAPRKIPLETVAFSVCLAAATPLSLREIKEQVLLSGYLSQSRYFESYLRRVIRRSPRFVCGLDSRWSVVQRILASPVG